MNSKKANWLFLSVILTHLLVVVLLMVSSRFFHLNIIANLILSELILLVPTLLFLVGSRQGKHSEDTVPQTDGGEEQSGNTRKSVWSVLRLRRMKPATALMVVLFTWLTMPLTTLVNMISMIFVDNTMMEMSSEILDAPFLIVLFLMAAYGPFCEELTFRGAIYGGYRRDGRGFSAVLLSGLLFGLMHMNFNQAAYAFVIGILLALLVEATGSLWSSVLYHFLFNAQSVCLLFLMRKVSPKMLEQAQEQAGAMQEGMLRGDVALYSLGIYFVLAAVCTTLAFMALVWMAQNENRSEELRAVLPGKQAREKACEPVAEGRVCRAESEGKRSGMNTLPLVLAIAVCFVYMVLDVIVL